MYIYRQQSWHLGIENNTLHNGPTNNEHKSEPNATAKQILPTKLSEYERLISSNDKNSVPLRSHQLRKRNIPNETEHIEQSNDVVTTVRATLATERTTVISGSSSSKDTYKMNPKIEMKGQIGRKISVLIHNMTLLSEDDRRNMDGLDIK